MPGLNPEIDPDGLLEYSVVFTDRSLNHMSKRFQQVMRDISGTLKEVYNAASVALVPGGGTCAMEAVARQFATDRKVMVIRNGFFSYRWSQIFELGQIPADETVLMARPAGNGPQAPFSPPPIDEVLAEIAVQRPDMLFAPHVETASGMILPDDYLAALGRAMHDVGGLFVLDCIASGTIWVDMEKAGVDVLISAPQKGWSGSPSAGMVMLNAAARTRLDESRSTSFALDLARWVAIMEAYESGAHAYHATMPTDALARLRDIMNEMRAIGFDTLCEAQWEQGRRVRAALASRGVKSVAAPGFEAPGVVVSHTDDPDLHNGSKFAAQGLQVAAGVPLMVDEGRDFRSFRIGLFGLDKLKDVDATLARLEPAFDRLFGPAR